VFDWISVFFIVNNSLSTPWLSFSSTFSSSSFSIWEQAFSSFSVWEQAFSTQRFKLVKAKRAELRKPAPKPKKKKMPAPKSKKKKKKTSKKKKAKASRGSY
jgi:hypothetical protein